MKIIAKEIVPTREEIRKRFEMKLGGARDLFRSITALYAEEAERLLMETWLTNDESKEKGPETIDIVLNSRRTSAKYHCTNCDHYAIYPSHNYCPKCGLPIKWIK